MDVTRALVGVAARSLAEVSAVSLRQFRVLALAGAHGPLAMGDLARALEVTPSTATRLCESLEAKGHLERNPASGDRRTIQASLTPSGRRVVDVSLRRRRQIREDALAGLDADARRRLDLALPDLTAALAGIGDEAWALGWPGGPRPS